MASTSILLDLAEMAELRTNGLGISILILLDAEDFATISSLCLGIKFGFATHLYLDGA